ncbi:pyruvate kinase [Niallia sp. NCCP-28]|uniref:pyruvate kinase n=1 Tax=Niallia sp. NCCP-28 TaxID=2934712 RepID=UPI002085EF7E|nr:pyruvate kinase [Niallia sp. NCCP-28]GKU82652.1 pyruvate kinase [Niallia sp. NCCP-28]
MSIDRIATIGPASNSKQILTKLIQQGMTIARLNFSHGTHETHRNIIDAIRTINQEIGASIKILGDLQGPKIRLGEIEGESILLETGEEFTLSIHSIKGNEKEASVDYKGIVQDIKKDDRILMNDGAVELKVLEVKNEKVETTIVSGGEIASHKGVNLPGVSTSLPAITDKDKKDIDFLVKEEVDYIACSFVRKPAHLEEVRTFIKGLNGKAPQLIAKIETIEAIENFSEIVKEADGIMIARGDLGVELPYEWIPLLQKAMITECNRVNAFVITATQMLQSMIEHPLPTRAEVTDVFQAVLDGANAVMLSGESAAGNYPVESMKTLTKVSEFADSVKKDAPFAIADMEKLIKKYS